MLFDFQPAHNGPQIQEASASGISFAETSHPARTAGFYSSKTEASAWDYGTKQRQGAGFGPFEEATQTSEVKTMCKETLEILNTIFGFAGDTISFAGAFMIAKKEAGEYSRVKQEVGAGKAFEENPELKKIRIEIDGVPVQTGEDVKMSLAKRASHISRQGAGVLAVGFVFLFLARVCESLVRYCW
jgi:hypothetical protein